MKYNLNLITDERNALSIILRQIEKDSLILEFGSANGRMTKYLKEVLNGSVYIVEIEEAAALDAMKFATDGYVGDIEEYAWLKKWEDIRFDYIVFADVLEHLHDPQQVLSKTKQLLKDDGKVMISVPNIAHNSVLINLYNNTFNYTPLGLLDNTHIHFFAYNTLKEFCDFAGYVPVVEDAIYSQVGSNEIENSYDDVSKDVAFIFKQRNYGNVYQFVFTLQKKEYVTVTPYQTDYRIKKKVLFREFKIYLDRGSGFCEDNCITYHYFNETEFIKEIDIENCEDVQAIRIDPFNMGGIYKINKIQVLSQDGIENITLNQCTCNGTVYGEYILADNDDPQIVFQTSNLKGHAKLYIEMEDVWLYPNGEALRICREEWERYEEELEGQAEELEHRMDEINDRDSKIAVQNNEIKLLNEELDRRAAELEHRMDEINDRDSKIAVQNNEIKLLNEELDRRAAELEHRMDEINLRDKKLPKHMWKKNA